MLWLSLPSRSLASVITKQLGGVVRKMGTHDDHTGSSTSEIAADMPFATTNEAIIDFVLFLFHRHGLFEALKRHM